jgi:phosphatidylglycerophosphatase A
LLFRFFDIIKPPPIRQLDEKLQNGFGVMIDDIIAGVMAWCSLQLIIWMAQ